MDLWKCFLQIWQYLQISEKGRPKLSLHYSKVYVFIIIIIIIYVQHYIKSVNERYDICLNLKESVFVNIWCWKNK